MLNKNLFASKGLSMYSRYIFQVQNFYTYDHSDKKGITMLSTSTQDHKNEDIKKLGCFNLQNRLSHIRQYQKDQSNSTTKLKKLNLSVSKENEENIQRPFLPLSKNIEKELVSSISNNAIRPLSPSYHIISIKSKVLNSVLKRQNDNEKVEELNKKISNVGLDCILNKELVRDDVSLKLNKEISDCMINQKNIPCSIKEVAKDDLGLDVSNKPNNENPDVTLNQPVGSLNQERKCTLENRLFSSNFNMTSSLGKLCNGEDVLEQTKVDKKKITNDDLHSNNLTSVLNDFDLNLQYINEKMSNLTLSDQVNDKVSAINENYKRIISYSSRLKHLQQFVNSSADTNTFSKNNRTLSCFFTDGELLGDKKFVRKILTARRSYKTSSSLNDSDQELKAHQGNKASDKEINLFGKKNLPANNLHVDLNNVENKSHENVNIHTKKEPLECKHIKVQNYNEIRHLHEKFPFPKSNLHNYYQILSEQLKDKSLIVESHYKAVKIRKFQQEWDCTYHLKWPENCKISAQGLTKKRASTFAALRCLLFLEEHGKISHDGLPLVYTKEDVKKITQKKETELRFNDNTINKMITIVDIFKNNMKPFIKEIDYKNYNDQENKIFDEEAGSVNLFLANNPTYLEMHQYFAKEKVELPISHFKDNFIELLQKNRIVIVKGEPGCGKSSRVPQYVLESWIKDASSQDQLCRIAVTQPRRIAAISLAERVASERDEELGQIVGYQVRLKSNFQTRTGRILYCTTGILLRHLQNDPNLTKFSHVIIDEAHERDLNTDLLMNLLKTAMKENENLKVVVMSATIDAEEFSEYFGGAPVLDVPGFTYPVTKHFLDGCQLNVSKTLKMCDGESPRVIHQDVAEILEYIHKNKPEGAILTFLPGWEDLIQVQKLIPTQGDVVVHLVHSKLKDSEQHKIFSRPPPGVRKIILATNIAETSITIDDVVYVVDTGIHKDQIFDNNKGINVIDMEWISKASANQRAGRAGRCSPGESFHLYTKEKFSNFPDYSSPKILNSSLTKVVLDSKMFTNNMDACDFMNSLITPPEKFAVERAVDELKQLELLDENEKLTPLGATLVNFQLEPSLAKAMVNGVVFKCTTPIVDIVTLFSSDTGIFGSSSLTDKDQIKIIKSQFSKTSDHLALMGIYENWLELIEEKDHQTAQRFCRDTNLVPYKLEFVKKLKDIHMGYLYKGLKKSMPISDDNSNNNEIVKAILYSGTGTVLQHRNWDMVKNRLKTNVNVLVTRNNHKATISSESVNYKRNKFPSDFLVYINETRSNVRRTTTVRECSLIPAVSVLLFSNKKLEILEAGSNDNLCDNLVKIGIKNTKLQFVCDKVQADVLMGCKEAIDQSYKYLIHQLTYTGEEIPEFLENWDNILKNLVDILDQSKVE